MQARRHAPLRFQLDPITVYGRDPPSEVALRWTATCTNLDGVVTKDLAIPVRRATVPLSS
jgi:hypothetical protein